MNHTATAAERWARFNVGTRFEDLPAELIARAKRHVLDTLGAALAGSSAESARQVASVLESDRASNALPAPLWGTARRLGARDAAFANGVATHALELDDSGGCDHSGAVVLPAAIAALSAADHEVSGPEFLIAVVLGYDLGRRVLDACGGYSAHNGAGWHSTGTCGSLAAAAAAARVLGLTESQTRSALGHAASFSGGLWAFIHDGSQTKRLHAGRAAEGGLTACLMARAGVTGPAQVFEDVWGGFLNAFAPTSRRPEALLQDLGVVWQLLRASIKPHAACRSTHAAIDAVLHLMSQDASLGQHAERIEVAASPFLLDMCGGRNLSTLAAAQMSLPYAVAVAWVFGDAALERYLEPVRADPQVAAAMARVILQVDPTMTSDDEPRVTIHARGRAPMSQQRPVPLGAPDNPLPEQALMQKFQALASIALPRERADTLARCVLELDSIGDARAMLPLLRGHAERHAALR
ncbi:MAG: MmgE/PrpD family protein [Steroidobacteraceae bacterium]